MPGVDTPAVIKLFDEVSCKCLSLRVAIVLRTFIILYTSLLSLFSVLSYFRSYLYTCGHRCLMYIPVYMYTCTIPLYYSTCDHRARNLSHTHPHLKQTKNVLCIIVSE